MKASRFCDYYIIIKILEIMNTPEGAGPLTDDPLRNLRSEAHVELKSANRAWMDCITKNFLPQWLNGEKLNIEEVCLEEKTRMDDAD